VQDGDPTSLEPMTIVIASYQRRDALLRLLRTIDAQAAADGASDLDVVVVLDGSTDGSKEAIDAARWTLPTRVIAQPNRGPAAARNAGLHAVTGTLVWFLDDDLVPADGLLARHRAAHRSGAPEIVVGRAQIPEELEIGPGLRAWWDRFHADLATSPSIDRYDLFTVANTSGPVHLFRDAGGFDERFRLYGMEDYELAYRLLARGTHIRYDADAVALHPDVPSLSTRIRRQRGMGANAATLVALHPELRDELFPITEHVSPPRRLIAKLRLRGPRTLGALEHVAYATWWAARHVSRTTARRAERVAGAAAHAAGVASVDSSGVLLARVLGQSS